MINKEAFRLLGLYTRQTITLEVALDEIKSVLGSDFDHDGW